MWPLLISVSFAGACDPKPIQAAFADISPTAGGDKFVELVACDAAAAKTFAPEAFKKIIAGTGGDAAAVAAIRVGAGDTVRAWVGTLEPDDRGPTLARLGDACATPEVATFFVDAEKALTDKFYSGRWWAALDSCRAEPVQKLLSEALTSRRKDRTLFGGLLDVYARNLGGKAIPALAELVKAETDPAVVIDIIDAFSDAAGVGDVAGVNAEAAKAADEALKVLAPTLPEAAADQARKTFLSLGDEAEADKQAAVRFRPVLQPGGGLLYGVIGVEVATCKKGDTKVEVHHAQILEAGRTWPDQLADRADAKARAAFAFELAASCKGTSTITLTWSETPFKDTAAFTTWLNAELNTVRKTNAGVDVKVLPAPQLAL